MNSSILGLGSVRVIHDDDEEYPIQLFDLEEQAPPQLYVIGHSNLAEMTNHAVSITGSRAATAYGCQVASDMARALSTTYGIAVVSGGSFGIDAAAHLSAASSGKTIAVLPSGFNYMHPLAHQALYSHIVDSGGLLVSQYPPDTCASRERFLARARIVTALGQGTVLVEASIRSSVSVYAVHALEMDRPLMAVPGPVTSEMSVGTNKLISTGEATCVVDAAAVVATLKVAYK